MSASPEKGGWLASQERIKGSRLVGRGHQIKGWQAKVYQERVKSISRIHWGRVGNLRGHQVVISRKGSRANAIKSVKGHQVKEARG